MSKNFTIACTGYDIAADWYEGTVTENIIFALPGYSSSKARQEQLVAGLVQETGASALVIDYSGHGMSPFELRDTRPAQHFLEVICAFDWITTTYPDAKIIVTGSSYGGFLATQLTKYRTFDKLVLRAPAIYQPQTFYDLWAKRLDDDARYQDVINAYRKDVDALAAHPLLARASKFAGKSLVVVHELDEQVSKETTDAYIKAFNADVFLAVGFPHTIDRGELGDETMADYQQNIIDWLS